MPSTLSPILRQIRRLVDDEAQSDGVLLSRFAVRCDEAAFAELLRRHGPMVHGVCRRVLDESTAEDAFQATFLVLVRRASSIRNGESVGSWLYGVAARVARKARADAVRREAHERGVPPRCASDSLEGVVWRDLRRVLDEELERLPEKYRAPLVLCYLEGLTHEEAARQLGWPNGTVCSRLARGRDRLRDRLTRRGLALSAGTLAALAGEAARAAVRPALLASTERLALMFLAGETAAGMTAPVASLVESMTRAMFVSKLKATVAVLVAAILLTAGAGVLAHQRLAEDQPPEQKAEPSATKATEGAKPAARVDVFGDPLPEEAVSRLGTVRFRHGGYIGFLGFTSDGKTLVSSDGFAIRLWDPASGKELRRLEKWKELFLTIIGPFIGAAELSPDRKLLAIAGEKLGLWDPATDQLVREFSSDSNVSRIRFSPDGKLLATLTWDSFTLWNIESGEQLHSWKMKEGRMGDGVFTRDGKTLITGGDDKVLRFWDTATGRQVREIAGSPTGFYHLALSPDGTLLATVGVHRFETAQGYKSWLPENRVRLWDVKSGKELRQLEGPSKETVLGKPRGFMVLAFAPDGKSIFAAGADHHLHVWDPVTGQKLPGPTAVGSSVSGLAFSPDGKTLAVACGGKSIRLLDVASGKDLYPFHGHEMGVYSTVLTPDGRTAATGGGDKAIYLWDPTAGRLRKRLDGYDGYLLGMRVTPDGRTLLSVGSDDKTLRAWNLPTGKELYRADLKFPQGSGLLALSPDGKTLVVGGPDNSAILLDAATGKEVRTLKGPVMHVTGSAILPDGNTLVVWCSDHTVHVWDLTTGRQRLEFPFAVEGKDLGWSNAPAAAGMAQHYWAYVATVSPDGRLIAYGSQMKFILVQELSTGKLIRRIGDLPDKADTVAFSPDGKTLACGGGTDPTIHLVELETGTERHRLNGHQGATRSLTFSADGRTLISGNDDTTALVWDLTGRLAAKGTWGKALTAAELDALWLDLVSADAVRGFKAVRVLAASPAQAVPFLRTRLPVIVAVDEKRLARLLGDLDSGQFGVREAATVELEKLGETAVPAYRKVLAGSPSAEVRRRVEDLLDKQVPKPGQPAPQRLRDLRAVEALERVGTPEARQLLEALAGGLAGARLTEDAKAALSRLAPRPAAP